MPVDYLGVEALTLYEYMGDMDPTEWAKRTLDRAVQAQEIDAYQIRTVMRGPFDLYLIVASVYLKWGKGDVRNGDDHKTACDKVEDVMRGIYQDSLDVRWVSSWERHYETLTLAPSSET